MNSTKLQVMGLLAGITQPRRRRTRSGGAE